MPEDNVAYQEADATPLVDQIFGGNLSTAEAIEKLRTRLLDLTTRNRLLSFKFPKGRCIPIVGDPNYNQVFDRLLDGNPVRLLPVSEPPPDIFQSKKLDVRIYAEKLEISTSQEFSPSPLGPHTGRRMPGLQVLLYPGDMDRQVRKIANEAKTAIEETGSNMLFLIVGYLEFYESDDSDKPLLAPLLSLPATLIKGAIDPVTRTYQWSLQYNGEDTSENATLKEKLKQFPLHLPDMEDDEEPEGYFVRVEKAIKNKRRWRVRRQLTIGMLSFGKLAVWADLDTIKNPNIAKHPQITNIFEGGGADGDGHFFAPDYNVDERPDGDVPLIYDADSSQHSAIIDVLAGKNLVINGPPGTGKSQTITNLIAAALSEGKKVLFVAEKLAALEVVRHRLNQANLGHFCLELHSHKTQKKQLIEDIKNRLEQTFRAPPQFNDRLATLRRLKKDLAQHVELMGSKVANELDLTVHDIFWACERRRADLGDLAALAGKVELLDAPKWTVDNIQFRREQVEAMADLWTEVRSAGQPHPWDGFRPNAFVPGDDDAIAKILCETRQHLARLVSQSNEVSALVGTTEQLPVTDIVAAMGALEEVPDLPEKLLAQMLPALFDSSDPLGQRSGQAITRLTADLESARKYHAAAYEVLHQDHGLDLERVVALRQNAESNLSPAALKFSIEELSTRSKHLWGCLADFRSAAGAGCFRWAEASETTTTALTEALWDVADLDIASAPVGELAAAGEAVSASCRKLAHSLDLVADVANRKSLVFDDRPAAIGHLLDPGGIEGLVGDVPAGLAEIEFAQNLLKAPVVLAVATLETIETMIDRLWVFERAVNESFSRCMEAANRLGLRCDGSTSPEEELRAILTIAERAPLDLLRHRRPALADRGASETISRAKHAIQREAEMRAELVDIFHIDAAPAATQLKAALTAFRRGDKFFNIFSGEWRRAKKVFDGIAKERKKRSAAELAESFSKLQAWQNHCNAFNSDQSWTNVFGDLFQGFATDVEKVERLHTWHLESHTLLVSSANLFGRLNLTTLDAAWLEAISARAEHVKADVACLEGCEYQLKSILGVSPPGFREARRQGWPEAIRYMETIRQTLTEVLSEFRRRGRMSLSPTRIVELMEARLELENMRADVATLAKGVDDLRASGGPSFHRMLSDTNAQLRSTVARAGHAAAKLNPLLRILQEHADPATTVWSIKSFIEAKVALEQAITELAPLGEGGRTEVALVSLAERLAATTREMAETFCDAVDPERSTLEAFVAVATLVASESTIAELAAASETVPLFRDAFNGFDTDCQAISDTHNWGVAIATSPLPKELRQLLLSPDAVSCLNRSRTLYKQMAKSYKGATGSLGEMSRWGDFELNKWIGSTSRPSALLKKIELALSTTEAIMPLSKWLAGTERCRRDGLGAFVDMLEKAEVPAAAIGTIFETSAYLSIAKSICRAVPQIAQFDGRAHTRLRDDFKALDRQLIELTGEMCARNIDRQKSVPDGNRGAVVAELTEMHLLRREINKQKRYIPIRQLINRAGRALQELKPCFMMGPLSVAQYLGQGSLKFDLVVMDEASQLRPEDALGAIARGAQLVVVGDPKQLPPTNFFDRMGGSGEEDEEGDSTAVIQGMESILDICQQIYTPIRSLRWHYRSQHESLIAFSNHYFYRNLVVFPSPHADNPRLGVKWRYIKDGLYEDRRNYPEAKRIADAVIWHMKTCPEESLGVVTLNGTQRDLIEELLERQFRESEECRSYMDLWEEEGWPFFVKNLENVQGDERDCILISTTFGKPKGSTKVRQNFGPISRPDGWRRLNVLFTRAKRRVELFTSMQPDDIVLDEKTPLGTKALRDYLDFAKRGILTSSDETGREPDSDFEISVADALRAKGYEIRTQLGVAGFFIDLAVRNPDRPGEWLAAIECDGATYHSGLSVRDRDRIRQEILESLGWKGRIYRIWSTDWFYKPSRETGKLLAFLEKRRIESKQELEVEPVALPWEGDHDEVIEAASGADTSVVSTTADSVVQTAADAADAQVIAVLREDEADAPASDPFVEVGDRVTYCFADNPTAKLSVTIVEGASNPKLGIVNESTPLGLALLGLSQGEDGLFSPPGGQGKRSIRVLKVER